MGRTTCTEPHCLYKGALYLFTLHWNQFTSCFNAVELILNSNTKNLSSFNSKLITVVQNFSWDTHNPQQTKTCFTVWELPISIVDMINNFELEQAMSLIRERWRRLYFGINMSVSQNIYLSLIYSTVLIFFLWGVTQISKLVPLNTKMYFILIQYWLFRVQVLQNSFISKCKYLCTQCSWDTTQLMPSSNLQILISYGRIKKKKNSRS